MLNRNGGDFILGLPERHLKTKRFNKALFISKDESAAIKRRIKTSLVKITLIGQIDTEDIMSVVDESVNISAIMFIKVEVDNIRNALFLNNILQAMIKAYTIIEFCDPKGNISLGFAIKRLSKVNNSEVIVESSYITKQYSKQLFDNTYDLIKKNVYFDEIVNKESKLNLYSEMMLKAYIISNQTLWSKWQGILKSNIWYNQDKVFSMLNLFYDLKAHKDSQKSTITTQKNITINKKIMSIYEDMEDLINE